MKLYLPLACVALLSIGIAPSVAAEAARGDRTEASRSIALTPEPIEPPGESEGRTEASRSIALTPEPIEPPGESEELPQPLPDRAFGARLELSLNKSSIKSEKLETRQTATDPDRQPNPLLTQKICNNDDCSTSIPNPPPVATGLSIPTTSIPKVDEIEQPSTSAQGLLRPSVRSFTGLDDTVQISQSVVQVTGVRINPTANGLEVILETPSGQVLQAVTRIEGKSAISDIENAQLALPSGGEFKASSPDRGIASVTVTQLEGNRIQVSVTGIKAAPTSEVVKSDLGLVLGVTPSPQEDINIIVTTRRQTPYVIPNASSATRTDTPIRDIPQSIQVVPQEVIEDQQVVRLEEALRNVSGVTYSGNITGRGSTFGIRGFDNAPILRDGFRQYGSFGTIPEVANLDRVEVLKGPASILYGEIQPGGLINLVSKQPLSEPFYEAELQLGSRNFVSPRFDISGPLTSDGNLLYRLNGLYQTTENFRGYEQNDERLFIAPTLAWRIGDRTDLTVSLEYTDDKRDPDDGFPVRGNRIVDVPRDRISGEPGDILGTQYFNVGYNFEHRFSDNWKLRNAFRYSSYNYDYNVIALPFDFDDETGSVTRFWASQDGQNKNYALQTNFVGEFATGSVEHTLIFGADISYSDERIYSVGDFVTPIPLNIFNPVYGQFPKPDEGTLAGFGGNDVETSRYGFYVQDQISILENLKLLAGLRYDTAEQTNRVIPGTSNPDASETTQTYDDFTPRVGIVYQPIPELSLYASYSRSFNPGSATTSGGGLIEPETGSGYEVGVKAELLDRRLLATLAYFDIKKQNVAVTDPNNPLFSIASGEQRSRGVELDVAGQILPGWNVIAAYAYTDAEVTADTDRSLVGNRLFNVPKHSASLWTTYEIQSGDLQGLGFGVGFNFLGERQGDLANSFQASSYFVTNAAVFYQRDNWRAAINVKNLFNIDYIEAVRNSRSSGNMPGEPLTVIGSFSIQF
ncbi:TonB-dependent receptor [Microcoleus sp. AT9b-C3]|uniref:TonB-dependent receptor n=1 Tax=Microcoleus sp. AT9b-C3 TaxID=2818629 RepID=UPI002FCEECCA